MRPEGINAADTAWLLMASALVLLMTPALALFYAGMVRRQNVLSTFMYVLAPLPIVSIEWALGGYGLVFGPSVGGLLGSPAGVDFRSLADATRGGVPALAFAAYQMMFAVITPALVAGAFVERMKFSSYLAFVALWSPLVYAPVAHWVWGEGGWLASLGALDFAGGTVVHASAGASALVGAFVLGPRAGYPQKRHVPHNLTMTLTGAGLLWFGWFGFNAGSALSSGALAALAFMTTHLGASAGALGWVLIEWVHRSKPTALGLASGLVAGLVAVTPAAGFVSPASSIVIGAAGSAACYYALTLKERFGYDDSLDAFGVHGVGGVAGALLTGVFAERALNAAGADGLARGNAGLLARQAIGVAACAGYAALATWLILRGLKATVGLRAAPADESEGLDVAHHGEQGYTLLSQAAGAPGPLFGPPELAFGSDSRAPAFRAGQAPPPPGSGRPLAPASGGARRAPLRAGDEQVDESAQEGLVERLLEQDDAPIHDSLDRLEKELRIGARRQLAARERPLDDPHRRRVAPLAQGARDRRELGLGPLDEEHADDAAAARRRRERLRAPGKFEQIGAQGARVGRRRLLVAQREQRRAHQVGLGGPAAVNGRLVDPRPQRHVVDAQRPVALPRQFFERRLEHVVNDAGAAPAGAGAAWRRGGHSGHCGTDRQA